MSRKLIIVFCFTAGITFVSDATALSLDIRSSPENQLDVSLLVRQSALVLKDSSYRLNTDISQIGFRLLDIPRTIPIQLGLAAGYAFIDTQTPIGLNNGNLGGGYLSLLSRITLFNTGRWSSQLTMSYSYLVAHNNSDTQKTRLRWNHILAEAEVSYYLSNYLSLTLGGAYSILDARLTQSGDTNISVALTTENKGAGFIGFNYHVDLDQKVVFQIQRGYFDSFTIKFQRTF